MSISSFSKCCFIIWAVSFLWAEVLRHSVKNRVIVHIFFNISAAHTIAVGTSYKLQACICWKL